MWGWLSFSTLRERGITMLTRLMRLFAIAEQGFGVPTLFQ
jgi:hypothetical protein